MANSLDFKVKKGLIVATTATIQSNTNATSTTTGALVVAGGVGIGGKLYAGGLANNTSSYIVYINTTTGELGYGINYSSGGGSVGSPFAGIFTITNTSNSISSTTGALQVLGGVGIAKDLFVGGTITIAGSAGGDIDLVGGDITNVGRITANTGTFTTTNIISTSNATSTSTGALTVAGGVGIGGNLYVGGTINGTFTGAVSGTATTATNIAAGLSGQLHYQTGPGATGFVSTGTAGQVLVSGGTGSPVFQSTLTLAGTTAATSTNTGALQVAGGVGVGGSLYVGTSATIYGIGTSIGAQGPLTVDMTSAGSFANVTFLQNGSFRGGIGADNAGNLYMYAGTAGAGGLNLYTTAININKASFNFYDSSSINWLSYSNATTPTTGILNVGPKNTAATSTTTGALTVVGGVGIAKDLYVGGQLTVSNTNANTATSTSNALYVSGGAYIDKSLVVVQDALFKGPVTFSGSATYILSTNTYYTDNILELHTPPGGVFGQWTTDNGKDIGFRFHYYTAGTDTNAALVLDNTTKELHWYSSGAESVVGDFSTATFGTFRTSKIILNGSSPNAASTNSGDLQVQGGVGIGGSLYVAGVITATTFVGNISGTVTGTASTATNIAGGTAGSLPYQSSTGTTTFLSGAGTQGSVLRYFGTAPTWTTTSSLSGGTASSSSVASQSLTITSGGLGVTGASYFSTDVNIAGNLYAGNGVLVNRSLLDTVAGNALTQSSPMTFSTDTPYGLQNSFFTGSGSSHLVINQEASSQVSTGDLTLEFWFKPTTNAYGILFQFSGGTYGDFRILKWNSASVGLILKYQGTDYTAGTNTTGGASGAPYTLNAWNHGAFVRSGTDFYVYTNGTKYITLNGIGSPDLAYWQYFGRGYDSWGGSTLYCPNTYFTNVRLTKSALYTGATYTVPTAPLSGGSMLVDVSIPNLTGYTYQPNIRFNVVTATTFVGSFTGVITGAATQVQTVAQPSASVYYPTFVSANNASATGMSVYTTSNFAISADTGNISIGTRFPYSWTTTYHVAQLGLLWGDFYSSDSGYAGIATNLYYNGTQWINKGTNVFAPSPLYEQNAAGATFTWYASTGTAGTTATLTTLKILDPSGLTVGYTSNSTSLLGAKFAVNGGVRINGITTSTGNILISGTAAGGNSLVIQGGSGASTEGAQIVMGYGNNQAPNIVGQANYTWNIDVATGLANNDLRIFRQNSAGATAVAAQFTEATGGVQLISVGVGTTSSGVTGELRATNEITAYFSSDARLKENVVVIENALEKIDQIRGVYFDWTDEHIASRGGEDGYFVRKHDVGVIAQEIEAVLPEVVADRDDGYKAVKYEKIVPLLIAAIKEQQEQINHLSEILNRLVNK